MKQQSPWCSLLVLSLMETKTTKLLDGKTLAAKIQQELSSVITELQPQIGRPPRFSGADGWRQSGFSSLCAR